MRIAQEEFRRVHQSASVFFCGNGKAPEYGLRKRIVHGASIVSVPAVRPPPVVPAMIAGPVVVLRPSARFTPMPAVMLMLPENPSDALAVSEAPVPDAKLRVARTVPAPGENVTLPAAAVRLILPP